MNDMYMIVIAGTAGVMLGFMFFGGLWWTIQRGLSSPHPALWFLGSLLLRTTLTLAGIYLVCGTHGQRLAFCLIGFTSARLIVLRSTRFQSEAPSLTKGPGHAS